MLRQICGEQVPASVVGRHGDGRAGPRCARERGQAMVLFAIVLPLILAFGSVVISVGNWYVHKRHLQTEVDAAAFAGATKFVGCSFQFGDPVAANAAIRATALAYAGDTIRDPATTNLQEQQPDDVRVVLNSSSYWTPVNGTDPTNGYGLDDTQDSPADPDTAGDPCNERALDVKATDDEAPLLWGWFPYTASPKSHARVEIRQIKEQMGMLPFAVPEIDPAAVAAIFVEENTGAVLDFQPLCDVDDCVGLIPPDSKLSYWMTTEPWQCPEFTPGCVTITSENTGVVILVSKEDDTPLLMTGGPGTLTTICTQAPNLVRCYAGDGNQDGLTFIHGWSDIPGTPAAPQIRDVTLQSITCTDDLSAPYFLLTGDCDVGVTAVIDFGLSDPIPAPPIGASAQVELNAPGCGGGCQMTYSGPGAGTESIWITSSAATLGPASGRATFSIGWATEPTIGTTASGTFTGVAHPYVADDASGPILYLELDTSDPLVLDANSRNQGDVSVIVTVGLNKPFQIKDPLEPPILLRYASPSGSLNQALDCDANAGGQYNLDDEIANGCQTTYALNYADWDKDKTTPKTWADITCSAYGINDLPPPTFDGPAPNCVAAKTGDVIAFRKGLADRFESPCVPNNWPETADEIDDFFLNYDLANDPRYVTLIITDITAFTGSGAENVPVKYFAGFYATGWDISPQTNGCPGENDPHPLFGPVYKLSKDNGDVWGHFINIIAFSSSGKPSDELCNFDELGNCIAVLVE